MGEMGVSSMAAGSSSALLDVLRGSIVLALSLFSREVAVALE